MYGTDYPFGPEVGEMFIREILAGVKSLNITGDDLQKILSGNARKL